MQIKKNNLETIGVDKMYTPWKPDTIDVYGRKINSSIVNKIRTQFDVSLLGSIVVCDVSEEVDTGAKYEIIDGNHRIHAIRNLFGVDVEVEVQVLEYMEEKDRASMFLRLNANRSRVGSVDSFRAGLIAGHQNEQEIWDILQRRGLKVKGLSPRSWPYVNGLQDVYQIFTKDKRPNGVLDLTIHVLIAAYEDASNKERTKTFNRECMRMVSGFLFKTIHNPLLNIKRLIDTIRKHDSVTWARRYGGAIEFHEKLKGEAKWVTGGYVTLQEEYNKRLSEKNQL